MALHVQVPHPIRAFTCRAGYGRIGKSRVWYTSQVGRPGRSVMAFGGTSLSICR